MTSTRGNTAKVKLQYSVSHTCTRHLV